MISIGISTFSNPSYPANLKERYERKDIEKMNNFVEQS